ncbi:hypothetical protein B0G84_8268 [Paraburkholderia sp. BL8N3]|nr:hypothetical protein [Paraburkholderia sp. BL8N3]TCK32465.1 hypothetical protein B0G84_8268 [Paraburkholderia sp. BL8N3]
MQSIVFDVAHDEAFVRLGALAPGQQWSSFDVSRDEAIESHATLFVTSIWNYHSVKDEKGKRIPTDLAICEDLHDGTLWYKFSKPSAGAQRKTWVYGAF